MAPAYVVDSNYGTLLEAISGTVAPQKIRDTLALVDVEYISFDGLAHKGQVVMHASLESEVKSLFKGLLEMGFRIEKVIPVAAYGWDDVLSMEANNSSGFNYRRIIGTQEVSAHSYGYALDLNPKRNPYYAKDGCVYPAGATYEESSPGTITVDSGVVALFEREGWVWLGHREHYKDYQHFQKVLP